MLEIFILIKLSRKIHAIAEEKGRTGSLYVLLLILCWFGGEIGGAFGGLMLSSFLNGGQEPDMLMLYVGAIAMAALGAFLAFTFARAQPALDPEYTEE